MARVILRNIHKSFGKVQVINDCSLQCFEGELLTLLGPSGCGKTTLLRIIAGFIYPDKGDIYFDDKRVNDVPPNRRDTAMVFQSYALFPHMTVKDNVSFGLKMKKIPPKTRKERVEWALDLVGLAGFEDRYPRMLSGGQQQRVALARALVMQPKVLLLDEPLSNLDAKLREKMRIEIRKLQQKLGITAIYVTHDQTEALAISDRIAILNQGSLLQIGRPEEIYRKPNCKFVADFIGQANFIRGRVMAIDQKGYCILSTPIGTLKVNAPTERVKRGMKIIAYVRPEDVTLLPAGPGTDYTAENRFKAKIAFQTYLGNMIDYHLDINGNTLRCQQNNGVKFGADETVDIYLPPERCGVVM